ncbi:MAG: DUF4430 domain-containing protein [Clostridia bacterium]|nr:DUF4430 domain-containing protein [Clostridia bacterium]
MKKITAFIIAVIFICAAFSSCGKSSDFIEMDSGKIKQVFWAKGDYKDLDRREYYDMIAEAYNSSKEVYPIESEDLHTEWTLVVLVNDDDSNGVFTISYYGQNGFRVSVSGNTLTGGKDVKYRVVNEKLATLAKEELTVKREVTSAVKIKFSDGDGNLLAECDGAVTAMEGEIPSVITCVADALSDGDLKGEFSLDEAGRVISFGGLSESHEQTDGKVVSQAWKYFVNGDALDYSAASLTAINDGDVIELVFTESEVSAS